MKEIENENDSAQAIQHAHIVLRFTCPECGGHELMEFVEQGEEVHTPITKVSYRSFRRSGKQMGFLHVILWD